MDSLVEAIFFIVNQTKINMQFLLLILAVLWGVQLINSLTGYRLNNLGIYPRRLRGIPGIALCPLLHTSFNHLFFNSIPLFIFCDFMLIYGAPIFIHATIAITLISGTLIWLFGREAIHIGASALITGYWAYLVMNMYYRQDDVTAILLGFITIYYFAGIFFGIFFSRKGVSWEGHLFGLAAGVVTYIGLPYWGY